MPPFEAFENRERYYATLAHETTHWTRHPTRLEREFGRKRFGDEGYAMEELVAELGSAFLAADLDITQQSGSLVGLPSQLHARSEKYMAGNELK